MSPGLVVPVALFLLVFGGVGLLAIRRPLLSRLAWREASRRRGQAALVIAGLMIGTATITAALVAADSVGDSTVDAFAYRNWGYVDLTVTSPNHTFPTSVAGDLAADPDVQGVTDGVSAGIEMVGSASDLDRRQGTSGVTLVGFDPAAQRAFGAYRLTDGTATFGQDLGSGEVLISRILASDLDAKVGDRLTFSLESSAPNPSPNTVQLVLRIAGIARSEGPGAYTLGATVFAPLAAAQSVAGTSQINVVRISAPGGIRDTDDASARAAPVVRAAVRALSPVGPPLHVATAKLDEVKNAKTGSEFITAMLLGMSALVVAAGSALIVNLIGMLAEERRSRLGVLRALGLRRKRLVGLSLIEGAMYSLAAGVVGTLVGLPAGRLVAGRFGEAFAQFAGNEFDFQFHFVLRPSTLVTAFATGTLLTLLVVWLASRRTANMSITAAIRNLPEPPAERARRRWVRPLRLGLTAVAGVGGLASGTPFLQMAGGLLVIVAASQAVRPRMHYRMHATLTGLLLAGWSFFRISSMSPDQDAGTFFAVFVVAMLASVFGLTILASANLRVTERLVGLLGRAFSSLRAILRPPLAYLSRRPLRTGLTTGVFAVIIGMLALFSVFFVIFRPDLARYSNGYDVRVLSTGSTHLDLPANVVPDVERSITLRTLGYLGPMKSEAGFGNAERTLVPLFVVGAEAASGPPVTLDQRAAGYATDADVWAAVASDPNLVVSDFAAPGQHVTLEGESGPVRLKVIGAQALGLLDGVFASEATVAPFASAPAGASMLVDLKPGVDAVRAARRIESGLFAEGVDADAISKLLDDADRANRAFFSTIEVLMRMGLIIGVLSLGIVALRIVTERRQVIGVLRALGYKRRAVMAGLLTEAGVTVFVGAAVGSTVGIVMGWLFYRQQESQPGFGIDLANLFSALALVFVAVLVVTIGPAWRASRLPPAEAVRYSE